MSAYCIQRIFSYHEHTSCTSVLASMLYVPANRQPSTTWRHLNDGFPSSLSCSRGERALDRPCNPNFFPLDFLPLCEAKRWTTHLIDTLSIDIRAHAPRAPRPAARPATDRPHTYSHHTLSRAVRAQANQQTRSITSITRAVSCEMD